MASWYRSGSREATYATATAMGGSTGRGPFTSTGPWASGGAQDQWVSPCALGAPE